MPQPLPVHQPVDDTPPTVTYRSEVSRLRALAADEFTTLDPILAAAYVSIRLAPNVGRPV